MANRRIPFGLGEMLILSIILVAVLVRLLGWRIAVVLTLIATVWQMRKWYHASTLWDRLGVPSAPAVPLLGHLHLLATKGWSVCDSEWSKAYGKIYGSYLFTQPELVVADPELLKKVLVKDFHRFTNRRTFFRTRKSILSKMLTALKDDEWKHTRSVVTPAFTSGKLKSCFGLMERSVRIMCDIIEKQSERFEAVDIREIIGHMSIDIIAAVAFALDVDAQHNPNNRFVASAQRMGKNSLGSLQTLASILFPWTINALSELFDIRIIMSDIEKYYGAYLLRVLEQRRSNPKSDSPDFLQLLINAASESNNNNPDAPDRSDRYQITDQAIVAQLFLFLNGGHETTAATLTFACYLLALNPDKQEIAFREIDAFGDKPITYEHLHKGFPYLDAIINETLRIFPPSPRFDRECPEEYQLTDQLIIPAGGVVCVPIYAIHHDPDNYPEPERFEPERFLNKQDINPLAFLPFGYGPRNCIGMRFALLESKLALLHMVKEFQILKCEQTEVCVCFRPAGSGSMTDQAIPSATGCLSNLAHKASDSTPIQATSIVITDKFRKVHLADLHSIFRQLR